MQFFFFEFASYGVVPNYPFPTRGHLPWFMQHCCIQATVPIPKSSGSIFFSRMHCILFVKFISLPSLIILFQMFVFVGFLNDLLNMMCQNLSMPDLAAIFFGNTAPLQAIRPNMQTFVNERIMRGQDMTPENIEVRQKNGLSQKPCKMVQRSKLTMEYLKICS